MVKKPSKPKPSKPKSSPASTPPVAAAEEQRPPLTSPEELRAQQTLLDIFSTTFASVLSSGDFGAVLQEVKQALYNRDFATAFGDERFLDVYAARWSPTRALCYARVLEGIAAHLDTLTAITAAADGRETAGAGPGHAGEDEREQPRGDEGGEEQQQDDNNNNNHATPRLRMLAIGGGAAEIVAFGAYLHSRNRSRTADSASTSASASTSSGDVMLLDTGPWAAVVRKLHTSLTTAPPLSKYASAAARAANLALVPPEGLHSAFTQEDALSLDGPRLSELLSPSPPPPPAGRGPTTSTTPLLVTLLFTLNELYTSGGTGRTTAFLRTLAGAVPAGSLLLVVDSPGSYSEATVGREAKRKYPMQWLLDHTLRREMGQPADGCRRWERLESHDSLWFRLAEGLRYPIALENMRYQMHLYRASSCARPGGAAG